MPRKMEYGWSAPNLFKGMDPNDAGRAIEELLERHVRESGKGLAKHEFHVLTVQDVLDAAASPSSPLHKFLEWDDTKAARHYRKVRTAQMLNNLCVVRNKKRTKTRAFAFVRHPDAPRKVKTLMRIDEAMERPETERQIIDKALRELTNWIGRYGAHRQLDFVGSSVEKLRRRIEAEYQATVFGR